MTRRWFRPGNWSSVTSSRGGGHRRGQVLEISGDLVVVQVLEETRGLEIGSTRVLFTDEAPSLDLGPGFLGRAFNGLGEVVCEARVSDRVRSGVVSMPKGAWSRASVNGASSTALCPDDLQVVGDGACFNDARVEVEKA